MNVSNPFIGNLPDIFRLFRVWDIFSFLFLAFLFLYVIFSLMVIRQVQLMNSALSTVLSPFLQLIVYLHFVMAILVFVLALLTV